MSNCKVIALTNQKGGVGKVILPEGIQLLKMKTA